MTVSRRKVQIDNKSIYKDNIEIILNWSRESEILRKYQIDYLKLININQPYGFLNL